MSQQSEKKKSALCRRFFDGETRTRTGDTTIFSRVLYQLSYLAAIRDGTDVENASLASTSPMKGARRRVSEPRELSREGAMHDKPARAALPRSPGSATRVATRPTTSAASIERMSPRTLLAGIALGRVAFGAALTAKPQTTVGPGWIGTAEAERPTAALLFRSVGARDIAIGAGTLAALRQGAALRPWLLGALLADAVDLVATLGAGKAVPVRGRIGIGLVAGGAVAMQLAVARSLTD